MKRFSIVFLTRSLGYGGAERQLVALACGLHQRGHRVFVLTYYAAGPLGAALAEAGVPILALGKRHRWDLVGPLARAVRTLRQMRPDVLHGYLVDANVLATLLGPLARARVVWGVRASALEFAGYPWLARVLFRLSRALAKRADLIIVNSQTGAADHIAAGYPRDRVQVVPNGIDTVRFRPDRDARERMRQVWGVDAGQRVIGLVGRLDPMKDHQTFLEAAQRLIPGHAEVRFVCIGDGDPEFRAKLLDTAGRLGVTERVRWILPDLDVGAVYNAIDLLTSSSAFGEGFSNVVGEAMACGVTCVVTDVGDSAIVVGDTRLVVPPRDPVALAEAWEAALSRIAAGGHSEPRQRIEREFNLDLLVTRTERALEDLLGASAAPGSR